ncbi:MAG: hypothetical protein M1817_000508 [Caeruleum heppii]|nr:MAG: hypothetical protein M1817_000508 [Caeruleum heppii]
MSPSKTSPAIDFTTFANIIDREPRTSAQTYSSLNPSTKSALWPCPVATSADLDDAVAAAARAFPAWSRTPFDERVDCMRRFGEGYLAYEKDFTELIRLECGKPDQFASAIEVKGAYGWLMHHTTLTLPEEKVELDDREVVTSYVPLGVVAAICPWNFPLVLSMGKIAPALVTGNCVIVKPSPFTPYSALKLVEVAQEYFPPGVIQVLGGDDQLGPRMTTHPGIQKISFTGSIATGKKIMESCAKTLKRVTLELGGNDATIVCPDVDIQKTAPEVALGAFQNTGQVCVATKRIYIHESIYSDFTRAMAEFTKTLKVGGPLEEGVMLGPIQNPMQYEKVKGFFADSQKAGHKFLTGGGEVENSAGFFIEPTIVDNPPSDSRIVTEEPFGPIVPTLPYATEEEAIRLANSTKAGLGACVFSKDLTTARRIAHQLEAGSVFINSFEKPNPAVFFGGHKESGIGGEWGTMGLLAYCNARAVHVFKS